MSFLERHRSVVRKFTPPEPGYRPSRLTWKEKQVQARFNLETQGWRTELEHYRNRLYVTGDATAHVFGAEIIEKRKKYPTLTLQYEVDHVKGVARSIVVSSTEIGVSVYVSVQDTSKDGKLTIFPEYGKLVALKEINDPAKSIRQRIMRADAAAQLIHDPFVPFTHAMNNAGYLCG